MRTTFSLFLIVLGGGALAQVPSPPINIRFPTLDAKEYTLTFTVTERNLLPQDVLSKRVEAEIAQMNKADAARGMDAATLKRNAEQYREHKLFREKTFKVTFARTPDKIYYEHEQSAGPPELWQKQTLYYNGKATYILLGRTLHIRPGIDMVNVKYFPMFGAAIESYGVVRPPFGPSKTSGNLSAVKCEAFIRDYGKDFFGKYVPGLADYYKSSGRPRLSRVRLMDENPFREYTFKDYQDDRTFPLARTSTITDFLIPTGAKKVSRTKEKETVLTLTSAEAAFPKFTQDNIAKMMRRGDPVVIEDTQGNRTYYAWMEEDMDKVLEYFKDSESNWLGVGMIAIAPLAVVCATYGLARRTRKRRSEGNEGH